MRALIVAALAATSLVPAAAFAQSAREAAGAQKEVQDGLKEVDEALAKGDVQEAKEDMQEVREDAKEAREDWIDYKKTHPNVFRSTAYVGPDGYVYTRRGVGYVFPPEYRTDRYYLNNFATYRLRAPGAGQRYIRYGNDVALIDIATGRIVRIYESFFL
jgi:Ni/Co efflux regulator RcnB